MHMNREEALKLARSIRSSYKTYDVVKGFEVIHPPLALREAGKTDIQYIVHVSDTRGNVVELKKAEDWENVEPEWSIFKEWKSGPPGSKQSAAG
jgi:hypothetical protein